MNKKKEHSLKFHRFFYRQEVRQKLKSQNCKALKRKHLDIEYGSNKGSISIIHKDSYNSTTKNSLI